MNSIRITKKCPGCRETSYVFCLAERNAQVQFSRVFYCAQKDCKPDCSFHCLCEQRGETQYLTPAQVKKWYTNSNWFISDSKNLLPHIEDVYIACYDGWHSLTNQHVFPISTMADFGICVAKSEFE